MKRALWAVPLLVVVGAWFARSAYTYSYTENGASPTWSNWIVQNYNGQLAVYTNGGFGGIYEKLPARLKALHGATANAG